jgi:hypothetical protein
MPGRFVLIVLMALAGALAACGPLPTRPHPGWDQPSYLNGVTGERSGGSG